VEIFCAASYLLFNACCFSFFFFWKVYITATAARVASGKLYLESPYVAFSHVSRFNTGMTIPLGVLLLVAVSMFDFIS